MIIIFLPFAAGLVTFLCCALIIRRAHKWDLIDSPNHRSSHISPTPSGGGIGLLLAGSFAGFYLLMTQKLSFQNGVVLSISCILAVVGLLDDLKPMSAPWRLGIQTLMAASLLLVLGGESEMQRFADAWFSRTLIYAFLLLVVVWWINLFNFMDGIDGLAAAQALFMLLAASTLLVWSRSGLLVDPTLVWMLCIAGATGGFLILNWAPAKIFMGDVGSIYLSFMVLSFGLLSIRNELLSVSTGLAIWAILGATFATDATITLITRILTTKRWYEAHRNHLYQRLARKFGDHRSVTLLYSAINILWLLPNAIVCLHKPQFAVTWAVLAYLPLIVLALLLGAGRPDKRS